MSGDSVVACGLPLLLSVDCDSVTFNVEEGLNVVVSPVIVVCVVKFCGVTDPGVLDEIIKSIETED